MTVKIHPYCDAFPDLPDEDLKALAEDIKEKGLQNPIWRLKDGTIIDGKNRLKACEKANVKPDYRDWTTKLIDSKAIDRELFHFVLSQNLKRRHMDASQRSVAAAKLSLEYDKVHGTNGEAKEGEDKKEKLPTTTLEMAAEIMGVSPRSVDSAAKVVKAGSADLVAAVEQGKVAVSDAAAASVLPKSEQNQALAAVESGKAPTLRKAAGKKLKRTRPAKPATSVFDDSEFDDIVKDVVKFLDARVKVFPNKAMHKACHSAVDKLMKEFKAWRVLRK